MRKEEINLRNAGSEGMRPGDVRLAAASRAGRETYRALADLFGALADPTRASIVHLLIDHELCTADIALVLGMKAPAASQHLRVLRGLGLVRTRRDGRLVLYRADDPRVAQIVGLGLAHATQR
jgi:ArsR family transcriptional regulator, lead/cadmium/zinc/bismuth-responsive transcriptional repressor